MVGEFELQKVNAPPVLDFALQLIKLQSTTFKEETEVLVNIAPPCSLAVLFVKLQFKIFNPVTGLLK